LKTSLDLFSEWMRCPDFLPKERLFKKVVLY